MPTTALSLRHFGKDEIRINRDGARKILVFFLGNSVPPAASGRLRNNQSWTPRFKRKAGRCMESSSD
jgi:hypothetical protein